MSANHVLPAASYLVAIIVILAAAPLAMGQSEYQSAVIPPGPVHPPVTPYPVEFGFSQHHSSTAYEGAARGRAALIQAHGNYELAHTQAQILYQQARWIDRLNDLEQTRALGAQKQMWQEQAAAERKASEERAAVSKAKLAERRRTLYRETYQLSDEQLDVATGAVRWPALLSSDQFHAERTALEGLVRRHFTYDGPNATTAEEITRRVESLELTLRRNRTQFDRDEYQAAQRFLIGLRYEAEAATQQG